MPDAVRAHDVPALIDEDIEGEASLLDVAADGVGILRENGRDLYASRRECWNRTTELAEPAAAVRSPGAAMKRQEESAARQEFAEASSAPFLIGQGELRRMGQRRLMHQNSFTSTSSPASTMSTWAGISK